MMRKSLYFTAPSKVELIAEEVPVPSENQVLIENTHSLISPGTELALYTGRHVGFKDPEITWCRYPLMPGYATVGKRTDDGRPIMYYGPHSSHGLLNEEKDPWVEIDAAHAEAALFARFAQISSTVPDKSEGKGGGAVLVLGAGLIGNFCGQLFHLKGHTVLMADLSERRLDVCRRAGIDRCINSAENDLHQAVKDLTEGLGVDIVVEATGVPSLVSAGLELVNRMGSVYLLGSTRGEVNLNVYKNIHRKGVSLIGAHELTNNIPPTVNVRRMAALLASGKLRIDGVITHRIKPAEAGLYYEHLLNDKEHYLGVVLEW